jgi:TRAP-type C4-dicarboxylate transport system substrate-binding protein
MRILFALAICCASAYAEPVTLRIATVAPEGTEFAREFKAFARDVETVTQGAVRVRWYFGGIAGDELEVADRIARGQLDGTASGGMLCAKLSPTMRALRVGGLVQTGLEARFLLGHLREQISADFEAGEMTNLGTPILGNDYAFLDREVQSLAELKQLRLWRWNLDEVGIATSSAVGLDIVGIPIGTVTGSLEERKIDGFIAIPTAALAFQWSPHARVLLHMPLGFLAGCLLISHRSWNRVDPTLRQEIMGSAAKAMERMADMMDRQEGLLLGGLFQRQGVRVMDPTPGLRAEYFGASRLARDQLKGSIVPAGVLERIQVLLADFRAEHH